MIEEHREKIVGIKDSISAAFDVIESIFHDPNSLPGHLNNATIRPIERITRIERDEHGERLRKTITISFDSTPR